MATKQFFAYALGFFVTLCILNGIHGVPLNETELEQSYVPSWEELGFVLQDDIWRHPSYQLGQANPSATKWDNGKMPYEFHRDYPQASRKDVEAGIAQWNRRIGTCVKIVPKTSADQYFVRITNGAGCNSYVGKYQRGGQEMNLNTGGCTSQGTVMHEFMHAVGFDHEHQRSDRDKYITVHYENISDDWKRWWQAERNTKILVPFNCKSIMHYPAISHAYSINNKPAFTAKAGTDCNGAGHRPDFENSDMTAIKKLYGCR